MRSDGDARGASSKRASASERSRRQGDPERSPQRPGGPDPPRPVRARYAAGGKRLACRARPLGRGRVAARCWPTSRPARLSRFSTWSPATRPLVSRRWDRRPQLREQGRADEPARRRPSVAIWAGSWTRSSRASASASGGRTTSRSTTPCSTRSGRGLRAAAPAARPRGQAARDGRGRNHYVDLFEDEDGWVWVGVHFGSRGFGHKTACGFLSSRPAGVRRARQGGRDGLAAGALHVGSELGRSYIAAMALAGEYAYAGRDVVSTRCSRSSARATYEVHNHHNFAWIEDHVGTDSWVVRKGCTPAFPGQKGFVGGTMGEPSVILRGAESDAARDLLYSTVHGAGRVMSRTQAAGKDGHARESAGVRDCDFWVRWNHSSDPRQRCPRPPGREGLAQAATGGSRREGDRLRRRRGRS